MDMMDRYSRQTLFTPIGVDGQKKLEQKHALIIGMGALGTNIAETLTRAGIGKLTIIDRDYIEASNLQRQHLYSEKDALEKWPKAIAAKKRLKEMNSEITIEEIVGEADIQMLEKLAPGLDLIVDGTDNFEIRFVMNDIAHKYNVPWIFGSCVGSFGSSFTIIPGRSPCLHCLLKKIPMKGQTCDTVGIIAPTVQMVTAYQTAEALKILTENGESIRQTYVTFDLWENQYLSIKADSLKDEQCLTCGHERSYPFLSYEAQTKAAVLCGRDTVQIRPSHKTFISLEDLSTQWKGSGYDISGNPYLVSVKIGDVKMVVFKDGRALVHGTNNISDAKKIYYSLMG